MTTYQTPVESHRCGGTQVTVKREDLCYPWPGPSFSKMRGVMAHIRSREEPIIGVLDTLHSKAGWAVSYAASLLGKRCVNFWPVYKADPATGLPRQQQRESARLGAEMVSLPAGKSAVLYHQSKRYVRERFGKDCYLMPNALRLPESITENENEARRTSLPEKGVLVISVSSGTVASGVLRGLPNLSQYRVFLHMGYSRDVVRLRRSMEENCGFEFDPDQISFIDEDYGYSEKVRETLQVPGFPCNEYYDAKAWRWMALRASQLERDYGPIVFWNIGA